MTVNSSKSASPWREIQADDPFACSIGTAGALQPVLSLSCDLGRGPGHDDESKRSVWRTAYSDCMCFSKISTGHSLGTSWRGASLV